MRFSDMEAIDEVASCRIRILGSIKMALPMESRRFWPRDSYGSLSDKLVIVVVSSPSRRAICFCNSFESSFLFLR